MLGSKYLSLYEQTCESKFVLLVFRVYRYVKIGVQGFVSQCARMKICFILTYQKLIILINRNALSLKWIFSLTAHQVVRVSNLFYSIYKENHKKRF